MLLRDTTGKGIMAVPDLRKPESQGRCFIDELLAEIAIRWPRQKAKTEQAAEQPRTNGAQAQTPAEGTQQPAAAREGSGAQTGSLDSLFEGGKAAPARARAAAR